MNKTNLGLIILNGIALVGLIVLLAMDKTVDVIIPVFTALLGALMGSNKEAIVAAFRKK